MRSQSRALLRDASHGAGSSGYSRSATPAVSSAAAVANLIRTGLSFIAPPPWARLGACYRHGAYRYSTLRARCEDHGPAGTYHA